MKIHLAVLVIICLVNAFKTESRKMLSRVHLPHRRALPDPVAYWPMNSEYLLNDTSGNDNHGENGGGAILIENAYNFTGSPDSYVEFPNNGAYDTRYSIHILMCFKPQGGFGPLFSFKNDSQGQGVHIYGWDNNVSAHFVTRDLDTTEVLQTDEVQPDRWQFISVSYNNKTGEAKLWIRNQVVNSTNIGTIELATNYEARIGVVDTDDRFLGAIVTCVQIYDRELTPAEVIEAERLCVGLSGGGKGDPHLHTYSGLKYNFQGFCSYTLTRDCRGTPPSFDISADFRGRFHPTEPPTRMVAVTTRVGGSNVYTFLENHAVIVNGVPVFHRILSIGSGLGFIKTGEKGVKLYLKQNDLTLTWNAKVHEVSVSIGNRNLAGYLCGLFGDGSQVKGQDLVKSDGTKTVNTTEFAESWVIPQSCP
ncbi:alpha-tectorin-like isoform X2 [Ptychodera flava]|uniref:alpha-tectorin-like isoform X2 n=1 Tax=Ptychodera flava TaxID=63121 RepID=UPI00396A4CEB